MWVTITAIARAIVALFALLRTKVLAAIYYDYFSPTTKAKRKKEKDFQDSNKSGDIEGMI